LTTLLTTLRGAALAGRCGGLLAAGRGGPRGVPAAALLAAAAVATAAATTGGAGDLRGRELQARPDLLDLDLEDGALLPLAGLVAACREAALAHSAPGAGHALG